MYFFRIEKLKREIAEKNLSAKFLRYFIGYLIILPFGGYNFLSLHFIQNDVSLSAGWLFFGNDRLLYRSEFANLGILVAMGVWQIVWLLWLSENCHRTTVGSFLALFFPIAWVVSWRFLITQIIAKLLISAGILFFFVMFPLTPVPSLNGVNIKMLAVICNFVVTALFYWRVKVHMSQLLSADQSQIIDTTRACE